MKQIALLVAVVMVSFVGCGKKFATLVSTETTGFSLLSTNSYMGEETKICASEAGKIKNMSWTVLNEDGFAVTGSCNPVDSGNCLQCNFEEAGRMTVKLSAQNQDGSPVSYTSYVEILDPAQRQDQPPVIVLDIKKGSNSVVKVSTDKSMEVGAANFPEGAYNLDLSQTFDEDAYKLLKFEMSVNGGAFVPVPSSYNFAVGTYNFVIRATDTKLNVREKKFVAYVACAAPNDLAISNVTATHQGNNRFSYAATVTGGNAGAQKMLLWDYNGDDVYDGDWILSTASNIKLTDFKGTRQIKVKAWDKGCNYQKELELPLNFATPRLAHDGNIDNVDQVLSFGSGSNYFIQADIRGLAGNSRKHANGQYIDSLQPTTKPKDVIRCPYSVKDQTLSIVGQNHYDISTSLPGRRHGMELRITGVNPNYIGLQANAKISQGIYRSDEQPDSNFVQMTYQQNNSCALRMKMQKTVASGVCEDGTAITGDVYTFYGKYSCDSMTATTPSSVAADDGAFYCETSLVDQCVGGGGKGGLPPTEY